MERSRLALVMLMCVLLFSQNRISGAEVEMKVRPGDNITLYCDRSVTLGFRFLWIRNCSHESQPSLEIDFMKWSNGIFQRYNFIHNHSSNSYDLHITNISVSDLGLYYCGEVENKVNKDDNGIISLSKVYYYGNRTTRLSLAEEVTSCSGLNITSVSECVLCWTLLFSVCPVCVLLSSLLSSICVYCLCQRKTTGISFTVSFLDNFYYDFLNIKPNVFGQQSKLETNCKLEIYLSIYLHPSNHLEYPSNHPEYPSNRIATS
ncbi:uncharacterized protein LOC125272521 isoform X1 [Megalobrama amblycephala]|uniref:uncharacterized protein LOC125272521 isoform X1 n=1 Tax=Megalobrama amblycephala TaxID=75352 RepID=UPI002014234A|nr:uncharacterized protein LOC125272521 isoform X1 [Megalobrama amblycephala]